MLKTALIACAAAALPAAVAAQTYPMPGADSPRIQTVSWTGDETIVLTALPDTTLTVMLEPGEVIRRASVTGDSSWEINISVETDSFQIKGGAGAAETILTIETDFRRYTFKLEADISLQAAYVVRVMFGDEITGSPQQADTSPPPVDLKWGYKLRGDKSVRPESIRDDGQKTVITYATGQALPAVFAIGPSGDEEVVDGYMRGDLFVIDRVHQRLVFRIDKEKATARRNSSQDDG
uniref:TrbG/VirB9 family P-type conjugative transfer protein n=1 Tax=uncultured Erythrobacter sp. TaxID=263913 RepID=UPI00260FAFE6|nr:TrbG/VirB9 family P-type conjugative transfer protein [uncultured Erythrobacter sp.]